MTVRHNQLNQPIGYEISDWQPCPKPEKTLLIGRYCRLEPVNANKHAIPLFNAIKLSDQGKNWTYLLETPFDHLEQFTHWLEGITSSCDPLYFIVVDQNNDQPVGIASYLRIKPEQGCIEVGHIHFSPLMQRTPMSTEAMFLMMEYAFDGLGYRRYEWKCDSLNQPSINAALRLGFTFEGTFRQAVVYKNRNRDTDWFSILDREWPEQKQRFQTWLHQNNFNHQGQQIKRLQDC